MISDIRVATKRAAELSTGNRKIKVIVNESGVWIEASDVINSLRKYQTFSLSIDLTTYMQWDMIDVTGVDLIVDSIEMVADYLEQRRRGA